MTPKPSIEKNELEKMKNSAEQNHNFSRLRKHLLQTVGHDIIIVNINVNRTTLFDFSSKATYGIFHVWTVAQ
jgi:hypothetical protein